MGRNDSHLATSRQALRRLDAVVDDAGAGVQDHVEQLARHKQTTAKQKKNEGQLR